MEDCGRWLLSGAPNYEKEANTSLSAIGNTLPLGSKRPHQVDRVCIRTKLENTSLSAHSRLQQGPPVIAGECSSHRGAHL